MPTTTSTPPEPPPSYTVLPQPVLSALQQRRRLSWIWLLPAVAVLVALSMAIQHWWQLGPMVTIHFQSAEGLVAGRSQIRYNEVVIGTVQTISLEANGEGVVVQARLDGSADKVANSGSRFWVVRPKLGPGGISGLNTLFSGAYIGVDAGDYANPRQTEFTGLDAPPAVTRNSKGTRYRLTAPTLGSLDIGSPVYYRRMPVGRITSFALDAAGQQVTLELFVDEPYDAFVTPATRFWNVSGVDVSLGADGLKLDTHSLTSIVAGGVAFGQAPASAIAGAHRAPVAGASAPHADAATPPSTATHQAPEHTTFALFGNQEAAKAGRTESPIAVRLRYNQSVRGLTAGATVELQGKAFGQVQDTVLDFDPASQQFFVWVDALLYPRQLGHAFAQLALAPPTATAEQQDRAFIRYLTDHGYRAQVKSANLITGQLYVSFERQSQAKPYQTDWEAVPLILPTVPGNFDQIPAQIATIATRLEKIRFDDIGAELHRSLQSARAALDGIHHSTQTLAPDVQRLLQSADSAMRTAQQATQQATSPGGLAEQTSTAMEEVQKAAKSLRTLGDYLHAHPDALLKGRSRAMPPPQPVPPSAPPPLPPAHAGATGVRVNAETGTEANAGADTRTDMRTDTSTTTGAPKDPPSANAAPSTLPRATP